MFRPNNIWKNNEISLFQSLANFVDIFCKIRNKNFAKILIQLKMNIILFLADIFVVEISLLLTGSFVCVHKL
jgi:hypothetical protein